MKTFLILELNISVWEQERSLLCIIILMADDFPFSIYFLDETFFCNNLLCTRYAYWIHKYYYQLDNIISLRHLKARPVS
jgi:hypothetical protein